jgi:Amt family ammonium transporter
MIANGMLAGLVAITAPCYFVDPWAAALIGSIAGILVIEGAFFVERKLKLDDPVGAIAVHGVNGTLGVLYVGIFSSGMYGAGWNGTVKGAGAAASGVTGILYDQGSLGFGQLASQATGVVIIWTVILGVAYSFFKIQDKLTKGGIRPTEEDELAGMDLPEMGVLAYPEFNGSHSGVTAGGIASSAPVGEKTFVS